MFNLRSLIFLFTFFFHTAIISEKNGGRRFMIKKTLMALAMAIIFSCSQAMAAGVVQVYDGDEKTFVAEFNAVASELQMFTFETTPSKLKNQNTTSELYIARAVPADLKTAVVFVKDNTASVAKLIISSEKAENTLKVRNVALALIGVNDEEFKALKTNQYVWCEAAKRYINIELEKTDDAYNLVIGAFSEKPSK